MQRIILSKLKQMLILVSIVIVLALAATGQTVFVNGSEHPQPATALVSNGGNGTASTVRDDLTCETLAECKELVRVLNQQLLKALDAFGAAEQLGKFQKIEIDAKTKLDDLKNQLLAVKDLIIAEQDKLIKRLQKKDTGFLASLKRILKTAEKILLIGVGVYVGKGI